MPQARVGYREGGHPQPYPIASGGCMGLGEDRGAGGRSWMGDNDTQCYPGQKKPMLLRAQAGYIEGAESRENCSRMSV